MKNFLSGHQVLRVMNAQAAGTSDQNGTVVDTMDYEGVCFVAAFGALTATQVTKIKAQQGALSDGTDMADLEGSAVGPMADADSNELLILDVYRPAERYVRCVVDRDTANAVIDGVIAILYGPRIMPVTQGSTVSASEISVSPAEGTA